MNAKNPKWVNAEHTLIDMEINHAEYGWLPFTASPTDLEEYGRNLFAAATSGEFGPVAEYVPPPPEPPYVASEQTNKLNAEKRLKATDWINEPDVFDTSRNPHLTNRDEFLNYRSWCRNIAVNPIAGNLDWLVEPTPIWS